MKNEQKLNMKTTKHYFKLGVHIEMSLKNGYQKQHKKLLN